MQFAAIPGLPETKEKLLNAVKLNHLAHALLFHGPEGSANLTLALRFSKLPVLRGKNRIPIPVVPAAPASG
jgi:DNA polymerase III delta prime subunit